MPILRLALYVLLGWIGGVAVACSAWQYVAQNTLGFLGYGVLSFSTALAIVVLAWVDLTCRIIR